MKTNSNPEAPMLSIWFGNFFEPFCSNRVAMKGGIADIAELGFTTGNPDSRAWEDFFAHYRGEPAGPYVEMQEFMLKEAKQYGVGSVFLALYLCGDGMHRRNGKIVMQTMFDPIARPSFDEEGRAHYRQWPSR